MYDEMGAAQFALCDANIYCIIMPTEARSNCEMACVLVCALHRPHTLDVGTTQHSDRPTDIPSRTVRTYVCVDCGVVTYVQNAVVGGKFKFEKFISIQFSPLLIIPKW